MTVSRTDPTECEACHSRNITRDEDVLDTWFSSALWPFSTLGWPDDTPDLRYFYPTDVLVTGYDIIFFWVARMIFSGMEHMKREPFKTVLIHGIIRDAQGRKMSKSLGNGVDPIEVIDRYGADALRMNILTGNSPGNDTRYFPERCEAMRNFANKLWNASRFVLMNLTIDRNELPETLEMEDKWILSKLNRLAGEVCDNLDRFELGVAAGSSTTSCGTLSATGTSSSRSRASPRAGGGSARAKGPALRPDRDAEAPAPLHALYHGGDLPALPREERS